MEETGGESVKLKSGVVRMSRVSVWRWREGFITIFPSFPWEMKEFPIFPLY